MENKQQKPQVVPENENGQDSAEVARLKELQAKEKRVNGFVNGEIQPRNEFQKYVIEKLRRDVHEAQQVMNRLNQSRKDVQQLEARMLELQGAQQSLAQDVLAWDKKIVPTPGALPPVEEPSEGAPEGAPEPNEATG